MRLLIYAICLCLMVGCAKTETPIPAIEAIESSVEPEPYILKAVPNLAYESQLPEKMRGRHRLTNLVPGKPIWVAEEIPETFWLLLYNADNKEWLVSEHSYDELFGEEDPLDNTALMEARSIMKHALVDAE